jgi:hypothetical protein
MFFSLYGVFKTIAEEGFSIAAKWRLFIILDYENQLSS